MTHSPLRRRLIQGASISAGYAVASLPAISFAQSRPTITHGVQSGDVSSNEAIIWSRADRPAKMWAEIATTEDFSDAILLPGPNALPESDFTGKMLLPNLKAGQQYHYRVFFQDFDQARAMSEAATGQFKTAPDAKTDIRFVWSGDVAGQGWGINEADGGMYAYQSMLDQKPDFFLHSGDSIYADGPITSSVELADGSTWTNIVTEEVSKVAETQQEFRGRYQYNLMDKNVLAFNQQVPTFAQWDDHETTNNWYPNENLDGDERYRVKSLGLLSARANKAFLEYMPIRINSEEPSRIYRQIAYGPHADIFMLDMRSYRADNSENRQSQASDETVFLGKIQIEWFKQALKNSTATWKIIGSDMPLGLIVADGELGENSSNGDGPVLGREFDIAEILQFIHDENIDNVVWLTADVHYTAAHYYDPAKAQFSNFKPFWEFVTGPLNAGTFGPNALDNTFGPEVVFSKAPSAEQGANLSPKEGFQFFGVVDIAGESGDMTVTLKDRDNVTLFTKTLQPA